MPCMSPRQSWLGYHLLCKHMLSKGTNGHIVWPLPHTETNIQDYCEYWSPSKWSRHLSSFIVGTGMHGWIKTFAARRRHEGSTETTLVRIKDEWVFWVKKLNPTRTTCCQDTTPCQNNATTYRKYEHTQLHSGMGTLTQTNCAYIFSFFNPSFI